jgi:hypothetical protein
MGLSSHQQQERAASSFAVGKCSYKPRLKMTGQAHVTRPRFAGDHYQQGVTRIDLSSINFCTGLLDEERRSSPQLVFGLHHD